MRPEPPQFTTTDHVKLGQSVMALVFFTNPATDDKGNIRILCDYQLVRPDNTLSENVKDAPCALGKLDGSPGTSAWSISSWASPAKPRTSKASGPSRCACATPSAAPASTWSRGSTTTGKETNYLPRARPRTPPATGGSRRSWVALITTDTPGGISPDAASRCPQPVSMTKAGFQSLVSQSPLLASQGKSLARILLYHCAL